MNGRKIYKLIFSWLLLLLLCKPLCLGGIGLYAKLYLRSKFGWSMQYGSIEWKKKGICFSDLFLADSHGSSIALKSALVSISKRHISIDGAHLEVSHLEWKQEIQGGAWTCSIRKGTFAGEGIAPGTFTFERGSSQEIGKLCVLWGAAQLDVYAHFEPDGMVLDGQFHKIEPLALKRLFGDLWGGCFSGTFCLQSGERGWSARKLYIKAQDISRQGMFECLSGEMNWIGELDLRGQFWSKGSFQAGRFYSSNCLIEEGIGSWSFDGAGKGKWDFSGLFQHAPLSIEGRRFSSRLQPAWVESSVRYGDCVLGISGLEQIQVENSRQAEEGDSVWAWRCEGVQVPATLVKLAQDIASLWAPELPFVCVEKGCIDGAVNATQTGQRLSFWSLEHLRLRGVQLSSSLGSASIEHLALEENRLVFDGVDVEFLNELTSAIQFRKWSGKGFFDERRWQAAGRVGDLGTTIHLAGNLSSFLAKAEIEGCVEGNILFSGGWDEGALKLSFQRSNLENFIFEASAWIDSSLKFGFLSPRFSGSLEPLKKLFQFDTPFMGEIVSTQEGFWMARDGSTIDWGLHAELSDGRYPFWEAARLENISARLAAGPDGISLFDARGIAWFGKEVPFFCPIFQTQGVFDFRLTGATRDWIRIVGHRFQTNWVFDRSRSHVFEIPFEEGEGNESSGKIGLNVPIKTFLRYTEGHSKTRTGYARFPEAKGNVRIQLSYTPENGVDCSFRSVDLSLFQDTIPLNGSIRKFGSSWSISSCDLGPCALKGNISWEAGQLVLSEGHIDCKGAAAIELEGKLDLQGKGECRIARFVADFEALAPIAKPFGLNFDSIQGMLEGEGYTRWDGLLESDFDFTAHRLKFASFSFENQTPIQLHYDSDRGMSVGGLDVELIRLADKLTAIRAKIGLLQYDSPRNLWIVTNGHFHLPADVQNIFSDANGLQPSIVSSLFQQLLSTNQGRRNSAPVSPDSSNAFGMDHPIDLVADIEMSRDCSSISALVKEGFIPWRKELVHVQNLRIEGKEKLLTASCDLLHEARSIQLALQIEASEEPEIEGRFSIGENGTDLVVRWLYDDALRIQSIEGQFGGIDASFHFEGESLIGSAHLDMQCVSTIIPERIATLFSDLKMGKGYELMGRLYLDPGAVRFRGILSGKLLELFGYQLRTLLAQVEFDPNRLRISDIKISDSAGTLKIDEIVAEGVDALPWTLSIPRLTISELRPSLLQKTGEVPGEMSPLVVRELQIENLKGLLEEGKTWTATGHFHFINSYKREKTIFDIPSDVLSRIVGIDLDLLIPVRGSARFSLKDGYFRLFDLKEAYSENLRSEFFLIEGPDSPTVDLDGNIKIVIKMKQFVLFKLTEAFLISIEGKLNNPKFHLEKKRRLAELLGL